MVNLTMVVTGSLGMMFNGRVFAGWFMGGSVYPESWSNRPDLIAENDRKLARYLKVSSPAYLALILAGVAGIARS